MPYYVYGELWDPKDEGFLGCQFFWMWDVRAVGCWGYGMLRMWDIWDVECSGCWMFGMYNVGCLLECGMLVYKIPLLWC